jgi:uncharacterized protein
VDSTLLALIAFQELGDNATAVIVTSITLPERELIEARAIAKEIGVQLLEMGTQEMELPEYQANNQDRCYVCKNHRYQMLQEYKKQNHFSSILDGSNADDLGDFRPGSRAAREHGVHSPLQEAGLKKDEIRSLAKELGLSNWNKPSSACLASRVPYGTLITPDVIQKIGQAEDALFDLGFKELRVRHHGDVARIEVPPEDFQDIFTRRKRINQAVKKAGYSYTTLDLQGFRSGSMNEGLEINGSEQN